MLREVVRKATKITSELEKLPWQEALERLGLSWLTRRLQEGYDWV